MRTFMAILVSVVSIAHARADELVKADTSVLDRLGTQARSEAAMGRRLMDRAAPAAPVVANEETIEVERLSEVAVQRVVAERASEVQACYEMYGVRVKTASGEVSVKMVIEPSGRISRLAVVAPGVPGSKLTRCVAQRVRRWRFPAAVGETEVEIPFVFAVAGEGIR